MDSTLNNHTKIKDKDALNQTKYYINEIESF